MSSGTGGPEGAAEILRSIDGDEARAHSCVICRTYEESTRLAAALLAEALAEGRRAILVGDDASLRHVTDELRPHGTADEVHFVQATSIPRNASPEVIVATHGLDDLPPDALRPLIVRHMAGFSESQREPEGVIEREANVDGLVPRVLPALVVCVYDQERFPPRVIRDAIYAHGLVITCGVARENPHHTPPRELIQPERIDLAVEGLLDSLEPLDGSDAGEPAAGGWDAKRLLSGEIARRALIERRLRESEELYRTLIEMSPDSIFVHSEGRIVFANDAAAHTVGACAPDEVLERPVLDFVHPGSLASVTERMRWMLQTGQPAPLMEERFVRLDGTAFYADVLATPLSFKGRPAIQVVMRDITERKAAEAGLQFRSFLLDSATDSILVHDAETGETLYANEAAYRLRGFTPEQLADCPRARLDTALDLEPTERVWLSSGTSVRYESDVTRTDGTIVPVERHSSVVDYLGRKVVVTVGRDVVERKRAEETIERMAFYDPLTGLANRTRFHERLEAALATTRRSGGGLGVLFLDIDHFKTINDTVGHGVGDELLKQVAVRLLEQTRDSDTVARLGGDEFTLLLPGIASEEDAAAVAEKLLETMRPSFPLSRHEIHATASIGVAVFSGEETAEGLLKNADTAMYRAKELGRNSYQLFHPSMSVSAEDRFLLRNDLRHALERDQLSVHFQPIVRLSDGVVVGAEALMRWTHPERGPITPAEFIPLAEETGWIMAIGDWVLREACTRNRAWHDAGYPDLRVAVNLSPRQFIDGRLLQTVEDALRETHMDPRLLELEVTESVAMLGTARVAAIFEGLRGLGVRIAIDDFGTGYSSLDYLKRFPVQTIKVDRSFVADVGHDAHSRAITNTVVVLGKALELNVVAEGVETQIQREFVLQCGCDEAQGYLYAPALPEVEFLELLREQAATRAPRRLRA